MIRRHDEMPTWYATALAGAIAGVVAGLVKLGCEVVVPPRPPGRIPEPEILISLFTHVPSTQAESLVVHFAFSVLSAVAYVLVAARFPIVRLGMGAAFGIAVWLGAHELVMPLARLTPPLFALPASEQVNEFLTHALWGWTIEVVAHDLVPRFARHRTPFAPASIARRS